MAHDQDLEWRSETRLRELLEPLDMKCCTHARYQPNQLTSILVKGLAGASSNKHAMVASLNTSNAHSYTYSLLRLVVNQRVQVPSPLLFQRHVQPAASCTSRSTFYPMSAPQRCALCWASHTERLHSAYAPQGEREALLYTYSHKGGLCAR